MFLWGHQIVGIEVRRVGEGLLLIGNTDKPLPRRLKPELVEKKEVKTETRP